MHSLFCKPSSLFFALSFVLLTTCQLHKANAQNNKVWSNTAWTGYQFSNNGYPSITTDGNGYPYVAFQDGMNQGKATVLKFDGIAWTAVGVAGFSADGASYTDIAMGPGNTPYVVFADDANNYQATVMKYNGTAWVLVGNADFSAGFCDEPTIAVDGNGTPYVAYSDGANSDKLTVMKYNGSAWVTVGTPGLSIDMAENITIKVDGNNVPYVAYQDDNDYEATVKKFNGTSWVTVGPPSFTSGGCGYLDLAIDGSNTPYVAFLDPNTGHPIALEYNGSSWVVVGNQTAAPYVCSKTRIAIAPNGDIYIGFVDGNNSNQTTVARYSNGVWSVAGAPAFSLETPSLLDMAVSNTGIPYIVYNNGIIVEDFVPLAAPYGSGHVCIGSPTTLYDSVGYGGTWSSYNPALATVNAITGEVTGIAPGIDTIYYTCQGVTVKKVMVVQTAATCGESVTNVVADEELHIYPNPAHGAFTLTGNVTDDQTNETAEIKIINAMGQMVHKDAITVVNGAVHKEITLPALPAGMYLLQISTGNNNKTLHFVID